MSNMLQKNKINAIITVIIIAALLFVIYKVVTTPKTIDYNAPFVPITNQVNTPDTSPWKE